MAVLLPWVQSQDKQLLLHHHYEEVAYILSQGYDESVIPLVSVGDSASKWYYAGTRQHWSTYSSRKHLR
jgi:hypothetical protein